MTGVHRLTCLAAALILVFALAPVPAKAQFAPLGGADGDMMTQMAPMLEMMKAKMGKRRFATMMQTMGPMMSKMVEGGGIGGIGSVPAGLGGDGVPDGYGAGMASGDIMGMLGGSGGSEMISMIPQLMQMAPLGGGYGRRHHRRRL
jgi:hypothetical protein